jgi:hypothetical protein
MIITRIAILVVSMVLTGGASFGQSNNFKIALGAKVPASCVKSGSGQAMLTHTNQLRPFCTVTIDKVTYTLAFSFKNHKIVHIQTKDVDFKTRSGLRVGDEIEVKKEAFYVIPQLEIRAPELADGWEPVVGHDDEGSEGRPNFVDKLPPGETIRVKIIGFSKGSN